MSLDASISPVLSTLVALKFLLPGLSSEYPPPERDEPRQAEHDAQRPTEDGCHVRRRMRVDAHILGAGMALIGVKLTANLVLLARWTRRNGATRLAHDEA